MTTAVRFSLPLNFMDPQKTDDGKIWAREKFLTIINERHLISKRINTSYIDVGYMSPFERERIVDSIIEEDKNAKEALESLSKKK